MPFQITCDNCGAVHTVDEGLIGRMGKCNRCGERIKIARPIQEPLPDVLSVTASADPQPETPVPEMGNAKLEIDLGSVDSFCGRLSFSFVVNSDRQAHLQVYAFDPTDLRKSGVFLRLDEAGYKGLESVVAKASQLIEQLRASGRMNKMST